MSPESINLTRAEVDALLEPWYHDFSLLGLKNQQRGGIYPPNQKSKQVILFPLIDEALRLCRQGGGSLRGIELFCADGYYGMYAMRQGAERLRGIDLDKPELAHARLAARIFGWSERTSYEEEDVYKLTGEYDFCICAGGLYHLSDPAKLLADLTGKVHGPLVVQTVTSLAHTGPDYFETPAPGWTWGSRFSYGYLQTLLAKTGWEVIECAESHLSANECPDDRGSAYLLCVPPALVQSGLAKKNALGIQQLVPAGNAPADGLWQRLFRKKGR
jgi:hypothetical protein